MEPGSEQDWRGCGGFVLDRQDGQEKGGRNQRKINKLGSNRFRVGCSGTSPALILQYAGTML